MFTHQTVQGVKYSSLTPVLFNKTWAVKASATAHGSICLVIFNTLTYDTIVKFFDDEDKAHAFIIDTVNIS